MTKKNILTIAIFLVILVGLYFGSVELRNRNSLRDQQPSNAQQSTETPPDTVPAFRYTYEPNYKPNQEYSNSTATFDGKIYKTELSSGQKTLVVPSVKKAYPPVGAQYNLGLVQLAEAEQSGRLYLTMIPYETDGFPYEIIRYEGSTSTFTKLKISNQYDSPAVRATASDLPFVVTTDNPASESDDRSLYLLDLEQDTARLITKLPNNETFNSCYQQGCLGGVAGEITWVDDHYIEASIYSYSETEKDQWGNPQNKFLEKRKFKVR